MTEHRFEKLFEDFKNFWEKEIEKIEKEAIDSSGVYRIFLHFRENMLFMIMVSNRNSSLERLIELRMLEAKLVRALETARSRYRLLNREIWARIAEGIGGIIYRLPKVEMPTKPK